MKKEHWLLISIIVVITLWILTPSLVNLFSSAGQDANASRGQFGDMYGFITSLFSGLTIIGLVYTIIQQQDDLRIAREALQQQRIDAHTNIEALRLARQEMELTKIAVEQSATELKKQSRQLSYQRFDNTFFNLLELNLTIVEQVKSYTYEAFFSNAEDAISMGKHKYEIINMYQVGLHDSVRQKLGLFASSMFSFLEWVCKEKGRAGREKYFPFVFSQLNKKEREFLFYYYNLDTPHPDFEYFEEYLIPYPRDQKIDDASKLFKNWREGFS